MPYFSRVPLNSPPQCIRRCWFYSWCVIFVYFSTKHKAKENLLCYYCHSYTFPHALGSSVSECIIQVFKSWSNHACEKYKNIILYVKYYYFIVPFRVKSAWSILLKSSSFMYLWFGFMPFSISYIMSLYKKWKIG